LLLLGGCHYASSPLVGFGGYVADTHTFDRNPNLPPGRDENTLYSEGRNVALDPLLPEGGNVWPGPPPPIPTLNDIEKQQSQFDQQGNPPVQPGMPAPPSLPLPQQEPVPAAPPARFAPLPSPRPGPSSPPVMTTPSGPLISNGPVGVPGGTSTATSPNGGTSIVVPNGNGTSTVIGPDGSTTTIPTPR
jgi:hypothetical protein